MEVALRRRLAGVAEVAISQRDQKATVTFAPGIWVFSAAEFRNAVAEADVEVLSMEARVCGIVDEGSTLRAGGTGRPALVRLKEDARPGSSICASGRLDESTEPYELDDAVTRPRG